jgi:arylsulfatase A-like enzyme
LLGKQNLYEHSVRVPLIVAGPGIKAGHRSTALCYLFDVMPTLCALAGVPIPAGVDGLSLVPQLQGRAGGRPELFFAYREDQRSVRDARWKLIEYPRVGMQQLFDLRRDPDERRNRAGEARYRRQLQALQGRLAAWQRAVGDPLLTNDVRGRRAGESP